MAASRCSAWSSPTTTAPSPRAPTAGFMKMVRVRGKLVGVTVVGAGAGELLLPWSLALRGRASPRAVSGAMVAYPTRSEASKALGFAAYEPLVFGRFARGWARTLAALRRQGRPDAMAAATKPGYAAAD